MASSIRMLMLPRHINVMKSQKKKALGGFEHLNRQQWVRD
jgi:hypothetical protein